ncbi:MAG: hypothetical protein V2J55_11920 [Candidatus Competibacteraceae bacterium]|jgi:hypothetical protein|nr:hypothetical protein [Candidatus Competibacteraceae bacterium]
MTIDTQKFDDFLGLSAALTGFSSFNLQGTGQASLYYSTLIDIVGEGTFFELLDTFHGLENKTKGDEAVLAECLRQDIFSSDRLGPIARNIIKLWYVGTWYQLPAAWRDTFGVHEKDITVVVSPIAFTEGLLWPTLGVNPPAAKAQGYGSWSHKPSVAP